MKNGLKYLLLFWFGAAGYAAMEIMWRGFTHWSMAICGGLSVCFLYAIDVRLVKENMAKKAIIGGVFITCIEFVTGLIVNRWLALGVWDYTGMPGSVLGQICLPYTVVWCMLSFGVLLVMRAFRLLRIKSDAMETIIPSLILKEQSSWQ